MSNTPTDQGPGHEGDQAGGDGRSLADRVMHPDGPDNSADETGTAGNGPRADESPANDGGRDEVRGHDAGGNDVGGNDAGGYDGDGYDGDGTDAAGGYDTGSAESGTAGDQDRYPGTGQLRHRGGSGRAAATSTSGAGSEPDQGPGGYDYQPAGGHTADHGAADHETHGHEGTEQGRSHRVDDPDETRAMDTVPADDRRADDRGFRDDRSSGAGKAAAAGAAGGAAGGAAAAAAADDRTGDDRTGDDRTGDGGTGESGNRRVTKEELYQREDRRGEQERLAGLRADHAATTTDETPAEPAPAPQPEGKRRKSKPPRTTDKVLPSLALFVLRVVVGLTMGVHGVQKLISMEQTASFFESLDFFGVALPQAQLLALLTGAAEVLIGVALIFGFAVRLCGAGVLIITLGAFLMVYLEQLGNPFVAGGEGFAGEKELVLAAVGMLFLCVGGGSWALDRLFRRGRYSKDQLD
ncbi:DoxX family membrane protein [Microlunatus sp. Y2014]|uniref:DoxX family protein n=1 Tax=Microlunatus sp. Y2014 TaxID=3418488 RepID=UPI003DA73289